MARCGQGLVSLVLGFCGDRLRGELSVLRSHLLQARGLPAEPPRVGAAACLEAARGQGLERVRLGNLHLLGPG